MFNSPYPTAVTEGKGTLNLCARLYINGACIEGHIIEASAETQSARVRLPGRGEVIAPFASIAFISLKYADGTVIQAFGAPRVHVPASIEFIQYAQV